MKNSCDIHGKECCYNYQPCLTPVLIVVPVYFQAIPQGGCCPVTMKKSDDDILVGIQISSGFSKGAVCWFNQRPWVPEGHVRSQCCSQHFSCNCLATKVISLMEASSQPCPLWMVIPLSGMKSVWDSRNLLSKESESVEENASDDLLCYGQEYNTMAPPAI